MMKGKQHNWDGIGPDSPLLGGVRQRKGQQAASPKNTNRQFVLEKRKARLELLRAQLEGIQAQQEIVKEVLARNGVERPSVSLKRTAKPS